MTDIEHAYVADAAIGLADRHAVKPAGFRWFSERVADCLALPVDEALADLAQLITDAAADKMAGYGPPLDDINKARRQWMALFERHYGRDAA